MQLVYRCPSCQKIIDSFEVEEFDEQSLGLNILTEEEKKDIINVESGIAYIDVRCDECSSNYTWNNLIDKIQLH